jgi:hypothetical protein
MNRNYWGRAKVWGCTSAPVCRGHMLIATFSLLLWCTKFVNEFCPSVSDTSCIQNVRWLYLITSRLISDLTKYLIFVGPICVRCKDNGLWGERISTGGHDNTHKVAEGMVLFALHSVTVLQSNYICSKRPPSAWIDSLFRFSMPTEMARLLIVVLVHVKVCGQEYSLGMLTVRLSKSQCICRLSAAVCVRHASCWRLPVRAKNLCSDCDSTRIYIFDWVWG